jgi:single-stranded DNA-binding protein
MLNAVSLVGKVTESGVKLFYREHGTPEARWTLLLEELGKDEAVFKLFCPVVAYGARGEAFAAALEPGDLIAVTGKLSWSKPHATKQDPTPQGRLCVLAWQVERLTPAGTPSATASPI